MRAPTHHIRATQKAVACGPHGVSESMLDCDANGRSTIRRLYHDYVDVHIHLRVMPVCLPPEGHKRWRWCVRSNVSAISHGPERSAQL